MVLAELEAALTPYAVFIALAVVLLIAWVEVRGVLHRAGTTSRRSASGTVGILAAFFLLGVFLVLEGWTALGGLALAAVIVIVLLWGFSSASGRSVHSDQRAVAGRRRRVADRISQRGWDVLIEMTVVITATVLASLILAYVLHV